MSRPQEAAGGSRALRRSAAVSIAAACFLVALKLVGGIFSGSLGLYAEAAHSGTDLVAAILTFYALGVSARPADRQHPYGHGKAEHLAALGEATFLVVVSGVISWEAVNRLAEGGSHQIDTQWWVFLLLGVVLAVDLSRAVVSHRTAEHFDSAAIASNALHFASDFAGTLAVIAGLVCVSAGFPAGDSIAALLVAVLVIVAAVRLIRRNVNVLMDSAPAGLEDAARQAIRDAEPEAEIRRLRARQAGGRPFIDLVLAVEGDAGLQQAHVVSDRVEASIEQALPGADVTVHLEPRAFGDLRERATVAAMAAGPVREVHNVRAVKVDGRTELSLHVKLPAGETLEGAHATADAVESAILEQMPELSAVHVHLEPLAREGGVEAVGEAREGRIYAAVESILEGVEGCSPTELRVHREPRGVVVFLTVAMPGPLALAEAHERASEIERTLRSRLPEVAEVVVHTEPERAG
ncbi:MAG: cation-efflux pump [Solirubrobacterales bacterium]